MSLSKYATDVLKWELKKKETCYDKSLARHNAEKERNEFILVFVARSPYPLSNKIRQALTQLDQKVNKALLEENLAIYHYMDAIKLRIDIIKVEQPAYCETLPISDDTVFYRCNVNNCSFLSYVPNYFCRRHQK